MDSLVYSRHGFLWGEGDYQGVAGFASLHTAIALLWALMAQHTVRSQVIRTVLWVNFALTVVATLYFGWHYIADDLAGAAIAIVAFRLAARVTGTPPPVPAGRTRGHPERPSACTGGLTAVQGRTPWRLRAGRPSYDVRRRRRGRPARRAHRSR